MAKKPANETKLGMLLTLIFFILATFITGTLAYFGYSEQDAMIKSEAKAKTDVNEKNKILEKERVRKILLRIGLGIGDKADQDDFAGLVSQHPDAVGEEYAKILAGLKTLTDSKDFEWRILGNEPAPRPTKTMLDLVNSYQEDANNKAKAAANSEKESKSMQVKLEENVASATKSKQDFDAQVKQLNDALTKAKVDVGGATIVALKNVTDTGTENTTLKLEMAKRDRNALEREKKLEDQIAEMTKKIDTLESKRERTFVDQNRARGAIERRDSGLVYINLGSTDFLRPGTRFSIFAADNTGELASTYRGQVVIDLFSREVKVAPMDPATERLLSRSGRLEVPDELRGAIEVIDIVGPHQATARVIYERDPIRNPIRISDKLFNPVWTPGGGREKVVVAGLIDLDGDANDDTLQFIRELGRVGVQVQSYLDPKTRKMIGSPLAYETD